MKNPDRPIRRTPRSRALVIGTLLALAAPAAAQQEILYANPGDGSSYLAMPESKVMTEPAEAYEAADDFDVVGTVQRLYIGGGGCFQCTTPVVDAVRVRFYEWTASGPGALQQEQVIPAGTPGLLYDASEPAVLDITLPLPFQATGKHFFSVQVLFEGWGNWGWWVANHTAPQGSPFYYRVDDGAWGAYPHPSFDPFLADLLFFVWGTDDTPPSGGSDPNGEWTVTPVPDPSPEQRVLLRDVAVISANDVWAVGEYDVLVTPPFETDTLPLALHWDGSSWTQLSVPFPQLYPGGNHAFLWAVEAAGPHDVWAAGGAVRQGPDGFVGLHLYAAHWDGSAWSNVPVPMTSGGSGNFIDDIEVVSADDVWFVGDWLEFPPTSVAQKRALTMHWDGSAFEIVDNPFFDNDSIGGHGLTSASALASDDVWAVGGGHDGDYVDFSEIVHWDGTRWSHVPGPTPGWFHRLHAVEAIAPDDVWAAGDYQDASGYHPLFLHWDGGSWTQVSSPAGGSALVALSPDEVYSAGAGIARWDGTEWSLVEDFDTRLGVSTVAIDAAGTAGTLWTVGREEIVGALKGFAARLVTPPAATIEPLGVGEMLLWGEGLLRPGTPMRIGLAGGEPLGSAVLVIGLRTQYRTVLGHTVIPSSDALVRGRFDPAGNLVIPTIWPTLPAGQRFWVQGFSFGANGLTGSNAVILTSR